jgi:hypothetical protein
VILQALLSIAFITLVAGALLTSALVNAKVAAHETATRLAEAALARGTDEFVNWAQLYVAKHGAATTWPTTRVVDQPVAGCMTIPIGDATCNGTFVTISYGATRSSSGVTVGPDPAFNLQSAIDEGRLSGSIAVTLTNGDGQDFAKSSRTVTLRILNAAPFAVVTGTRDSESLAGSTSSTEGDNAGYRELGLNGNEATPNPADPVNDKDTSIVVTMNCSNSSLNQNEDDPFLDNNAPGNDSKPWGASGGTAFESPCAPNYNYSPAASPPPDALLPTDNVYNVGSFRNSAWSNAAYSINKWPR